ncbi:MAG: thiamine ABC transporter substrate binding subunit [Halodesulfurarchaeum sp.]
MRRRTFLKTGLAGGAAVLAGCTGGQAGEQGGSTPTPTDTTVGSTTTANPLSGELFVATYQPFVDAPSVSPGSWIKEQFESRYPDATLTWLTPESELNYFIQRKREGVTIDADVYVGLNPDDLVRIDRKLGDTPLFEPVPEDAVPNAAHVKPHLRFDPEGRAIPFDTGFISLVYNAHEVTNPGTFEALTKPAYEDTLLVENAQTSDPGQAFLLWTIATKGADGYLPYWEDLMANGAKILGDWSAAYNAYTNGQRPIVVSYSTDQVYAHRYNQDMQKHQVGFLNDQGYATPEGMARFADTDQPELAAAFIDFMLTPAVQSKIPVLNVMFPATENANPPQAFEKYAHRPPEVVSHTYEELAGNLNTWVEQWAQQIVSG